MRWTTNTTTMRERSHRASPQPDYVQLAVDRRGLGPRDQEERRTQRESFVATYILYIREYIHTAAAVSHRAGFGCLVEKKTRGALRHVSVSGGSDARMLESGAERSALGASLRGARHSDRSSRLWREFSNFLSPKHLTAE